MRNYILSLVLVLWCGGAMAQDALTLSNAIQIGLSNNYDIQISEKQLEISQTNNNWGTAGRYPNVNFSASGSLSNTVLGGNDNNIHNKNFSTGVDLSWVLFDGFRVNITKQQLQSNEELSGGQTALLVENTIRDIVDAWFVARLEKEKITVAETLRNISNDRYEQAKVAKEIGSSTTYELLQSQNAYLADESSLLSQEVVYRNSVRSLNYLMGESPSKEWSIDGEIEGNVPSVVLSDFEEKMLASNYTLKNQYINQTILSQNTGLQKAAYMPTVSFGAGMTGTYSDTDSPFTISNQTWQGQPSTSLSVSYALFNGGNRKRGVEIAKINEEVGQLTMDNIKLSLTNQLYQLYDGYSVQQELYSLATEQEKAAALNLSISKEKFQLGAINSFNYRDVQQQYQDAAITKLNAAYNLQVAYLNLVQLTGGVLTQYGE